MIRRLTKGDLAAYRRLRAVLWPDMTERDNLSETEAVLSDTAGAVFVADGGQGIAGFVETSLRKFADGCSTSPVGFIEGWFVIPERRRFGVGRALIEAAEQWARSQGCTEMASDSLLDNVESQQAHERLGYVEVERAVRFRKTLG